MPTYTESSIENALHDISKGMSVRAAALHYGVPRLTLQARLRGGTSRSLAFAPHQRLDPELEEIIASWIWCQKLLGSPPTHAQIREVAESLLRRAGDTRPLGIRWIDGFLARNPDRNPEGSSRVI